MNRRPYTFVMRDWIYKHMNWFLTMTFTWFAGMVALSVWHGTTATVLSICTGMLVAHLVWGSAWIEGQQEYPEYLGGE